MGEQQPLPPFLCPALPLLLPSLPSLISCSLAYWVAGAEVLCLACLWVVGAVQDLHSRESCSLGGTPPPC